MIILTPIFSLLLSISINWFILFLLEKCFSSPVGLASLAFWYVLTYVFFLIFSPYNTAITVDDFVKSVPGFLSLGVAVMIFIFGWSISPNCIVVTGVVMNARDNTPIGDVEVIIDNGESIQTLTTGEFQTRVNVYGDDLKIRVVTSGFFEWSDLIEQDEFGKELEIKLIPIIRILVTDFKVDNQGTSLFEDYERKIPEEMKTAFVNCPEFEVVARGEELAKILEEIEFTGDMNQLFDPDQRIEMGKMVGANYIVTGEISQREEGILIQSEMLNAEIATSELEKRIIVESENELFSAARYLASTMVAELTLGEITEINHVLGDPRLIEMKGVNTCIPEGWRIWVDVVPSGTDNHYPQVPAIIDKTDWTAPNVYLGDDNKPEDELRIYHIYAILTNPEVHRIFTEYLANGNYEGFKELPEGAGILDSEDAQR